jgi:hypothetical protein
MASWKTAVQDAAIGALQRMCVWPGLGFGPHVIADGCGSFQLLGFVNNPIRPVALLT